MEKSITRAFTKLTSQSNTTASPQIVSPVKVEIAASHEENHGYSIENKNVTTSSENTACPDPIVAQDESSSDSFEEYLHSLVQESGNQQYENDAVNGNAVEEITITPQGGSTEKNENVAPDSNPSMYFGQGKLSAPYYGIEEMDAVFIDDFWCGCVSLPISLDIFDEELVGYKCLLDIPPKLLGPIFGKNSKNLDYLNNNYGAKLVLRTANQKASCVRLEAHCPIESKVGFIKWMLQQIAPKHYFNEIGNPEQLLRTPRLGKVERVHILSSYSRRHFFVTICDKKYSMFEKMAREMTADYSSTTSWNPFLPEPIYAGTVSVLRIGTNYYRALVVNVVDEVSRSIICFLLDYGKFAIVNARCLHKIKKRYMKTPFQAVSVMWAHAQNRSLDVSDSKFFDKYFKSSQLYIYPVRNETCTRAKVMFLKKRGKGYEDVLEKAVEDRECSFSEEIIKLDDQFVLNGTNTAYYFWSNAHLYVSLVRFQKTNGEVVKALDDPYPRPSQEHRPNKGGRNRGMLQHRTPNSGAETTKNNRGNNFQRLIEERKRGPKSSQCRFSSTAKR
ncbi:unnamed protein product [Rodentolepis nana]|uniref:Tudor domain-containing protein n=1 Tax=Rodentolepis nana TaxID=102285 RepID=A0A0R3TNU2_RODNA|nr:unnamed protein product [Rodentolepis nana]